MKCGKVKLKKSRRTEPCMAVTCKSPINVLCHRQRTHVSKMTVWGIMRSHLLSKHLQLLDFIFLEAVSGRFETRDDRENKFQDHAHEVSLLSTCPFMSIHPSSQLTSRRCVSGIATGVWGTVHTLMKSVFFWRFFSVCSVQHGFYRAMWDPDLLSPLSLFIHRRFREFSLKLLRVKQKDPAIK